MRNFFTQGDRSENHTTHHAGAEIANNKEAMS